MTIEICHSAAEGTLVHGTSRGDGTNTILKAAGFRWFRTLGLWGIPGSRDRQPNRHKIEHAAEQLRAAGHVVALDIDDTHRSTAEAEADRAERQEHRVDGLHAKAGRKADAAEAAWDTEPAPCRHFHREENRSSSGTILPGGTRTRSSGLTTQPARRSTPPPSPTTPAPGRRPPGPPPPTATARSQ